jgi:uncharacterized protein
MSLNYNVSQLLKSGVGDTRVYDFSTDDVLDLDGAEASDISGRVKFTLTNFGILAAVDVRARVHTTCARCLEPFTTDTSVRFEEEFQPAIDIQTGLPTVPREDVSIMSSSHIIDLREAIRENILLAMEIIPVCRPDCAGLCPTCGANRNVETCSCAVEESDSPFAALQGLLSSTED